MFETRINLVFSAAFFRIETDPTLSLWHPPTRPVCFHPFPLLEKDDDFAFIA